MSEQIYRSDTLLVRQVPVAGCDRWVITFDHYNIGQGHDREGFGESFLRASGISAIHILGRGNDWYQYSDVFEAAAVVRTATASAQRRVAYGSSMGGYAALRLAEAVGADAVFALSPQWSIDPAIAPWENRWGQDAHRIRWLSALNGPLRCSAESLLVYDPHQAHDRRHAAHIAAEVSVQLLPVPYCQHPATTFLAEIGLLGAILSDMIHERFDARTMAGEIRARRSRSGVYLGALAERQPDVRPRTAIALARSARAANPTLDLGMLSLARVLTRAGNHAEALAVHRELVAKVNRLPIYLVPFAEALASAGEGSEACAVAEEVVAAESGVGHLRYWYALLLWRQGERTAAVAQLAKAVTLNPADRRYRRRLLRYRGIRYACLMRYVVTLQWMRRPAAAGISAFMRRERRRTGNDGVGTAQPRARHP
ncbi:hypothetical protein [Sphingomonas sp. PAMC 26621]|uniref:hypothetical protein n=1 Tax=Sphingomonas sp. PAMC 26621 TaxID=1112213 RepID=UPI000287CFB6|nr:hypothetical protein [Sphingomonas sp. PAMC 26621]